MKVILNAITQPVINIDGYTKKVSPEGYMIYCARVSSPDTRLNHETAPKLLKYLIDHKHWSPFEMISIGFEIETSRAIAQQILRHRSFSFQEFSQRYSKVENIEPVELRYQADKNRQSSTIVMHGTLRSWIHFLDQRCDDHAQKEIRLIAEEIQLQLSQVCPWTAEALGWCHKLGESYIDQKIFEREAEKYCKHFICQHDSNGEIAINHCKHPDNVSDHEGDCTPKRCPLVLSSL